MLPLWAPETVWHIFKIYAENKEHLLFLRSKIFYLYYDDLIGYEKYNQSNTITISLGRGGGGYCKLMEFHGCTVNIAVWHNMIV